MKKVFSILASILVLTQISFGQTSFDEDPLGFWEGTWILKTTDVSPKPTDDSWKSEIGVNEFVKILDGKGLHRIPKSGTQRNEAYLFLDESVNVLYTFSIDPDGLVWESSASIKEGSNLLIFVGGAKNEGSLGMQTILRIKNQNEVEFEQKILKSGTTTSSYKGLWLRVPDVE